MPAHAFRALALRMPAVTEGSHVENADLRVGITPTSRGKIFATLPSQSVFPPEAQPIHRLCSTGID